MEEIKQINWSWAIIGGTLYLGIFPSLIALMAYNKGVQELGPSRASIFLNLIPVFTMIGAVIFLKEQISFVQILGGLFVIIGVMITNRMGKKKNKSTTEIES